MKERRRGVVDRRNNVVSLVNTETVDEVSRVAHWLQQNVQSRKIHTVVVFTIGEKLECQMIYAGWTKKYIDLIVGKLIAMAPLVR